MLVYGRTNGISMKKVIIKPGCITCGTCEFIAPEVFEVTDISHVKSGVEVDVHLKKIENAIKACPMKIIDVVNE